MGHDCAVCEEPATKRCAGCGKARYCSEKCQRSHWKRHIFDCNRDPSKPILTAYHLYLAVIQDKFPDDVETCNDYGFTNAQTSEAWSKLLGLYIGLINYHDIEPIEIHRWRRNGTLVQEIKKVFEKVPVHARGQYYPWFLQNQHLLDPSWELPADADEERVLETWRFVGGRASDTSQQHKAIFNEWPSEKRESFLLYHLLRYGWHPSPGVDLWVSFGFATCRNQWEERDLCSAYISIVINGRCALDTFAAAYKKHQLLALFRQYGAEKAVLKLPYLKGFLESAATPTVWDLKAYVYQEDASDQMIPGFRTDYGIVNCAGIVTYLQLLKDTYKKVFEHPRGDPLKLHQACISGKIFEYVNGLLEVKKMDKRILQRLMKNLYPLSEL